jgi:tetratricopeptide (TPR) repeat protein
LTANYTAPKDGEPFYYLGLALNGQARQDQAFDAFFKATWSEAWRSPAYFALAEIATRRADFPVALDYLERSLAANTQNIRALTLKAAILRHNGRSKEALAVLDLAASKTDPLDVRLMTERWLVGNRTSEKELMLTVQDHPATALETAAEFANAGLWQDGAALLSKVIEIAKDKDHVSPLAYYYLGDFAERGGDSAKAGEYRREATQASPDYAFPFQWESIAVLRRAIELNPHDARAPYYLGNLLFDGQPEEAVKLWELSAALDPSFPIVHRNLGLAYAHQKGTHDLQRAISQLEQAVSAPTKYAKHFAELDELYALSGESTEKRLTVLEQNHDIVAKRDDALSREIGLKVFAGKFDDAIHLMTARKFSVWEGGSLEVAQHWVNAHLLRGKEELASGKIALALTDFEAAKSIPDNLPSEQEVGRDTEINYCIALAVEVRGDAAKSKQLLQQASGRVETVGNRKRARLSEQQVQLYYQAMARKRLGQTAEAEDSFRSLIETGVQALEHKPDPTKKPANLALKSQTALAHYLVGLGHLGLGENEKAVGEFKLALEATPDALGPKNELTAMRLSSRLREIK